MNSVYIIKPEGIPHRNEIRAMIVDAGLNIVAWKNVNLTPAALYLLYPDVSTRMMSIIMREMLGKQCEMGIVEGTNAVEQLVALCGDNTNPMLCAEGTIRRRFADPKTFIQVGDQKFYGNFIHRSKNGTEVARDLKLYEQL